jgi:hypothetical protein
MAMTCRLSSGLGAGDIVVDGVVGAMFRSWFGVVAGLCLLVKPRGLLTWC